MDNKPFLNVKYSRSLKEILKEYTFKETLKMLQTLSYERILWIKQCTQQQ